MTGVDHKMVDIVPKFMDMGVAHTYDVRPGQVGAGQILFGMYLYSEAYMPGTRPTVRPCATSPSTSE